MADVQPENGFTKIADEILEQMARIKLNGSQFRILFVVWRNTYGWNRKEHELSLSFIQKATGLDLRNIRRELKELEERKIIFQEIGSGATRIIKFNKDYEQWGMGEMTHGLNDPRVKQPMGEIAQGAMGELTHGGMGELTQQHIHSLNTDLNTVSQSEELGQLSHDEIMKRSFEIEKHYCMRRAILDCPPNDFHEIKILMATGVPVEFAKGSIDRSFSEYKPKHSRDKIRTFAYLATAIYDRWDMHLKKSQIVEDRRTDHETSRGHVRSRGSPQESPDHPREGYYDQYEGLIEKL